MGGYFVFALFVFLLDGKSLDFDIDDYCKCIRVEYAWIENVDVA